MGALALRQAVRMAGLVHLEPRQPHAAPSARGPLPPRALDGRVAVLGERFERRLSHCVVAHSEYLPVGPIA